MNLADADGTVLSASLGELVAATDRYLDERELYQQAARSALYGPRWRTAGVKADQLHGREALRRLPLINGDDLIAMAATQASLRKALLTRPRVWVTSRGAPSRAKKWLPLTLADTAHWFARAQRVLKLVTENDAQQDPALFLAMNEPMPHVSNALPYLWERADYLVGSRRIEFLIAATSMIWRNHWDRFALQKQPGWLAGSVADARFLARELADDAGRLMRRPSRGIFWGEPLDAAPDASETIANGARAELQETFGLLETFSVYLSAECREMYAECPAHDGLHLWMDHAIHEILPNGDERRGAPRSLSTRRRRAPRASTS